MQIYIFSVVELVLRLLQFDLFELIFDLPVSAFDLLSLHIAGMCWYIRGAAFEMGGSVKKAGLGV